MATQTGTRTVLVTGAASGIGAGIAQNFAEYGYRVVMLDVNQAGLDQAVSRLAADVVAAVTGDVNIPDDAERAVATALERFGSLDVLVNNAGIEIAGTALTLTLEDWDRLMGVNLRGAFVMSKAALAAMRPGSSIINISSVHAFAAYNDCVAYDASKAALLGLTRAMALDHGSAGIRVNAICPGYIQTPLMDKWLLTVENREATLQHLQSVHPVGRLGTTQDVAEAALFLASERASFISGAFLVVDGGMTLAGK